MVRTKFIKKRCQHKHTITSVAKCMHYKKTAQWPNKVSDLQQAREDWFAGVWLSFINNNNKLKCIFKINSIFHFANYQLQTQKQQITNMAEWPCLLLDCLDHMCSHLDNFDRKVTPVLFLSLDQLQDFRLCHHPKCLQATVHLWKISVFIGFKYDFA